MRRAPQEVNGALGEEMRAVLLLVLATLLLALGTSALAQQERARPRLTIAIDGLDEDATKCGVSKSQLESIAALTLRNNGIQAVDKLTNPFLYVSTVFLSTAAGGCAFHTRVSIRGLSPSDFAKAPLGAFTPRAASNTELCHDGSLNTSGKATISANMTQTLENLIKQCLGQLDY
jgi:hypothetical protein